MAHFDLAPGETSRAVAHKTVEEIWFFLEGRGRVWVGERILDVAPGSRVVIPTGAAFQFAATAGTALRFLCYTSPLWPGEHEAEAVAAGGLGAPTV